MQATAGGRRVARPRETSTLLGTRCRRVRSRSSPGAAVLWPETEPPSAGQMQRLLPEGLERRDLFENGQPSARALHRGPPFRKAIWMPSAIGRARLPCAVSPVTSGANGPTPLPSRAVPGWVPLTGAPNKPSVPRRSHTRPGAPTPPPDGAQTPQTLLSLIQNLPAAGSLFSAPVHATPVLTRSDCASAASRLTTPGNNGKQIQHFSSTVQLGCLKIPLRHVGDWF